MFKVVSDCCREAGYGQVRGTRTEGSLGSFLGGIRNNLDAVRRECATEL